ncbi:MAG TPA: precorrin-6A/cobalt-precorrin-6A reductase, partial [Stellaceae bacterium]
MILGGTSEAAELARTAAARFGDALEVTTSLAGRTERPRPLTGHVRVGGFGGPAGLAAYLTEHGIGRLIDATHPFATRISAAARLACEQVNVPRLILRRPPWRRHPLDRWIEVDSVNAAAAIVDRVGRRAWLTLGASEIAAFNTATAVHFLVRLV